MTRQSAETPRRGLYWLLYASLALNLLIIGIVVGVVASGGVRDGARAVISSPIPLLRALDAPAREALHARLRATRPPEAAGPLEALRTTREMLAVLRADAFDAARFEALVTRQSDAFAARNAAGRLALFEVVATMSAADRRAYADRIEEDLRSRRDRPPRGGSGG